MENDFVAPASVQIVVRSTVASVFFRISVKILKTADEEFSHAFLAVGADVSTSHTTFERDELRADEINAAFRLKG